MNEVPESVYGPDKDFGKPKISPEAAQKQLEMDVLYAKTFSSQAGKKVLADLRSITIEAPTFSLSDGFLGIMKGYSREGQNALVRQIEARMKRANKK